MTISPLNKRSFIYFNLLLISVFLSHTLGQNDFQYYSSSCQISTVLHGEWFSREEGSNVITVINENSISKNGHNDVCIKFISSTDNNYTIIVKSNDCLKCIRFLVRTLNVLEKMESNCIKYSNTISVESLCSSLDNQKELTTMFATLPHGKHCKSSIQGAFEFAYRYTIEATSECRREGSRIEACQTPGSQFYNLNQQFTMIYKKCPEMKNSEDADIQYTCLGDWYVGKNHFFAVMNTRESRIEEKYRCFISNRDESNHLAKSNSAECKTLRSPDDGPERLTLYPTKAEFVPPKCNLPKDFNGVWINTANLDAEVTINSTHMVERWQPDTGTRKEEIYVCQRKKGSRYLMARLGINGCQKDYLCYDFVPRHHNIIRYRKGQAMSTDDFAVVCSWAMFDDEIEWNYDIMIAKNPVAIKCPIAGKFRFDQHGEIPFITRIIGGVTQAPRSNVYCKQKIPDFSVCDEDQKIIEIHAEYCADLDYRGNPVDHQSLPDYRMECVGYWKENLKSYLITYDKSDAYSVYRCWIYQRSDLNRVLMSMSVGAFCHIKQNVKSFNSSEGAQVALQMVESEREHDDCAMNFDDGSDLYKYQRFDVQRVHSASNSLTKSVSIILSLYILLFG